MFTITLPRAAAAFTLAAILLPTTALAQYVGPAQFPAVNFDRLMPGDPVPDQPGSVFTHNGHGWVIVAAASTPIPVAVPLPTASTPTPTASWADPDCQNLNPYDTAQAQQLVDCSRRPAPPNQVPSFIPGYVYSYGYSSTTAVVLGVTQDLDGVQVVTVRWLPTDGAPTGDHSIAAVRTPPTPGGLTQWALVGRFGAR